MKTVFAILYCIVFPFFNLVHPGKAVGRAHIPEGPVIICPNHTGLSDPLYVVFALGLKNRPREIGRAHV